MSKCTCGKYASFNYVGLISKFCKKCSEKGMVNTKNKKCRCGKQPSFNFEGLKAIYCKSCKEDNMVDVKSKKCPCGKTPNFNFVGLLPICCKNCKKDDMVDVRNKKCSCGKQTTFNFESLKAICCKSCKKDDMVDVINKRCLCGTIACFNYKDLPPIFCNICKENEMINVKDKKCICGKIPNFNFEGLSPAYCKNCKKDNMVNMRNNRCACGTIACFNYEGRPAIYCSICKENEMINVKDKKCVLCGLFVSSKKYDWYCYGCYCFTHPDSKPARRHLTKERAVKLLMEEAFPNLNFTYNKSIGGCSHRRPDWFIDCLTHCIVVECDENQHKSYEKICELARLYEILQDVAYRPLIVLRFNPDKYKNGDGETVKGCFPGRTTKPNAQLRTRFTILKKSIEYHINHIPSNMLTEEKFFFDNK